MADNGDRTPDVRSREAPLILAVPRRARRNFRDVCVGDRVAIRRDAVSEWDRSEAALPAESRRGRAKLETMRGTVMSVNTVRLPFDRTTVTDVMVMWDCGGDFWTFGLSDLILESEI